MEKTTVKKKISNREYPPKKCKKRECNTLFTPVDKRQLYCCAQHRIDHNNDERSIRTMPARALNQIHSSNQKILERLFLILRNLGHLSSVDGNLLKYDGYDWQFFTDKTKNELTGREISWSYHYGLEGNDDAKTFTLHERKKLPFL